MKNPSSLTLLGALTLALGMLSPAPSVAQEPSGSASSVTAEESASSADAGRDEDGAGSAPEAPLGGGLQDDQDAVRVEWRDGLRINTADGRFQFRLGGRIHLDSAFFADETAFGGRGGSVEDGVEIRRARVDFRGHVYERVEWRAQIDFAGGEAAAKDVWIGVRGLPTTLRLGHLKEPFSLEEITSSNYTMFIERSLMNVLAPSRNMGAYVDGQLADDRVRWAAGVFRETDGFGEGAGTANFTGRLAVVPLQTEGNRRLLHLGAGFTHKELDGSSRIRVRPEVHLAPRILDVTIPADSADYLGLELGANLGSLSVAAEYTRASFDGPGEPTVEGFYVSGGYYLTGESRPYSGMSWQRLRPRRNFLDGSGGPGAVMIGARYSRIDLSEASADPASELSGLTLGATWQWNPSTRLMLNWVRSDLRGFDETDMVALRMQVNL